MSRALPLNHLQGAWRRTRCILLLLVSSAFLHTGTHPTHAPRAFMHLHPRSRGGGGGGGGGGEEAAAWEAAMQACRHSAVPHPRHPCPHIHRSSPFVFVVREVTVHHRVPSEGARLEPQRDDRLRDVAGVGDHGQQQSVVPVADLQRAAGEGQSGESLAPEEAAPCAKDATSPIRPAGRPAGHWAAREVATAGPGQRHSCTSKKDV